MNTNFSQKPLSLKGAAAYRSGIFFFGGGKAHSGDEDGEEEDDRADGGGDGQYLEGV